MKIDNTYKTLPGANALKPGSTQGSQASVKQEAVSLSSLAGSMQPEQDAPIDMARIQEIKQAISEGRFKINAEAIADRLIESARDLVSNSRARQA